MLRLLRKWLGREEGQGMVEYGLIIALVALAVVAVLGLLGGQLRTIFQNIVDSLTGTP
ncbi:MAG: Flp family type IVb pilin [Acetobacteraceae bacterium]|nr:Flp family type IVb pilin [Acetobacteraceae bacterium]